MERPKNLDLTSDFHKRAMSLLANKLCVDFRQASCQWGCIEPENFSEIWFQQHTRNMDEVSKNYVFKIFLSMLKLRYGVQNG